MAAESGRCVDGRHGVTETWEVGGWGADGGEEGEGEK